MIRGIDRHNNRHKCIQKGDLRDMSFRLESQFQGQAGRNNRHNRSYFWGYGEQLQISYGAG